VRAVDPTPKQGIEAHRKAPSRPRNFGRGPNDRGGSAALLEDFQREISSCQARIFLHTNGSEIDIRCHVTKRKISDAVIKAETVVMLAIAFWDYFGARLQVANQPDIPSLPALVRERYLAANTS
jgi:hypothetical protein